MSNGVKVFFDTVVSFSEEYLSTYGYSRSGKTYGFYKISVDKKQGDIILFRRSILNTRDRFEFSINHAAVTSDDVFKYDESESRNVTVSFLKRYVSTQGLNYTHTIDELIVEVEKAEEYYHKNIEPELEKIVKSKVN